jgi:hypothetical protein
MERKPPKKTRTPRPAGPSDPTAAAADGANTTPRPKRLKVVVRLEERLARKLKAYSGDTGLDVSEIVAAALTNHLAGFHTVHRKTLRAGLVVLSENQEPEQEAEPQPGQPDEDQPQPQLRAV